MSVSSLPSHAFFNPTDDFWDLIRKIRFNKHRQVELTDCGCGFGITLKGAEERGIPLRGVDLVKRSGQHKAVEQLDATMLSWGPTRWPLICRPDGNGWCHDVITKARQQGASAIYIGVARNYERDLSRFRTRRLKGVFGEDDERAWIIRPLKKDKV